MAVAKYRDSKGNVKTLQNVNIKMSTSGWRPQSDWWDIDSILENDTEEYEGKVIILLTDTSDTINFSISSNTCTKIRTSDGAEYTSNTTHTWDKSKDKECNLGYKTRYFIGYFSNILQKYGNVNFFDAFKTPLYVIFKNLKLELNGRSNSGFFHNCKVLECINFINTTLNDTGDCLFYNNYNLRKLKLIDSEIKINRAPFNACASLSDIDGIELMENVTDMGGMFSSTRIRKIPEIDTSNITNFNAAFSSTAIQSIECLNFINATNVFNMFQYTSSLFLIKNISNIKVSGLSFNACILLNHDTLLRILNALYDYSEDTEEAHTITLGTTNLAKLTDEELAIGQNKGWTIS